MENPKQYSVARNGKTIGTFTLDEIKIKLKDGTLLWSDHYWAEGMKGWRILSELKQEIEQASESATIQPKVSPENQADASVTEEERIRKERIEALVAAKMEEVKQARLPKPWKCHTCGNGFKSTKEPLPFPSASGAVMTIIFAVLAIICVRAAYYFGDITPVIYIMNTIAIFFGLCSLASTIAFGVEKGLQQFHSYRPRCPHCSSAHCSKVEQ